MLWALGYATKSGLVIVASSGETLKISSVQIGNMHQPDAEEFATKFLSRIGPGDVVLSPSGPNYTYLPGAHARNAMVFWIHPGKIKGIKKNLAKHLLEHFETTPTEFYLYQPQNERLAALSTLVNQWLDAEKSRVAASNAASHLLRRQRDSHYFQKPDVDQWVKHYSDMEVRKLKAKLKANGIVLTDEQLNELKLGATVRADQLFASYFSSGLTEAEKKSSLDKLVLDRLEWFGVSELEDFYEKEAIKALKGTTEYALFDGLIGPAAKTRAEILVFIRNPLFYPTSGQLRSYAGLGLKNGQAHRRCRGESSQGKPAFKKALLNDFAVSIVKNDTNGFFQELYYVFKGFQTHKYWQLMELTADVYKALGKSNAEDDENYGEDEAIADDDSEATEIETDLATVTALVERLAKLTELDLIKKSRPALQAIAALREKPNAKELWRCFARSPKIDGLNLAMTPKRVDSQARRTLAATLLDTIYYRWLKSIDAPLPLADDYIYLDRYQTVTGQRNAVPNEYDHGIVLQYFQHELARLEQTVTLPEEVRERFIPKSERKKTAGEELKAAA